MVLDDQVLSRHPQHNFILDIGLEKSLVKMERRDPRYICLPEFQFYEPVCYLDTSDKFPDKKEKLGFWLDVEQNVGDELCFHILTADTQRVIERSVLHSAIKIENKSLPLKKNIPRS